MEAKVQHENIRIFQSLLDFGKCQTWSILGLFVLLVPADEPLNIVYIDFSLAKRILFHAILWVLGFCH